MPVYVNIADLVISRSRLMSDYKHTLNLPETDFPMKANLAQREPTLLAHWQDIDLYQQLRDLRANAPRYILHDGPPYANGSIHIGHAVNKILKDIIVKAKSLSGFDAPYVPGWDCHGLPIELNVEKKLGKTKAAAADFRAACRAYAATQIDDQRTSFKRLGLLGDWKNPYRTMDFAYEANTVRSLATLIHNGHLHKGFKPVHWCLDCASALAEAEVEYIDKQSDAIDVAFKVIDLNDLALRLRITLTPNHHVTVPIWTTTPWTLPANEAVALNPELDYGLIRISDTQYLILAEALTMACLSRYGLTASAIITTFAGKALEHLSLQHPFLVKHVKVILGDHVNLEAGTGAVHTAPAHGTEDYQVGLRYQLPVNNPVGSNGCFKEGTPMLAGLHVTRANAVILELLKTNGVLLAHEKIHHSFPHCWRHKTPLIFRATPQWFISMDQASLRTQALNAIDTVEWLPDWGKQRIEGMIDGRPDWCISRQRTWGVPIPLFTHKITGELHPRTAEIIEHVALLIEQSGVEAWFSTSAETLIGTDAIHYDKATDILDVWFDSGSSHYAVLSQRPELNFPADLYLEGSDQHRGWFQSSLLTSVGMQGSAPYKTVLTHGFTVDGQGRKMSKSLGNVIAPEKVIQHLGADVLRLWVASTDYRSEMAVSDDILKRTADTYRRIRNTARYLLANLHDFEPAHDLLAGEQLLILDACLLARAKLLQTEIRCAYDHFEFHLIIQKIQQFCSIELGSFYLDITKDRQYTCQTKSLARRSSQTVIYHLIQLMTRWLAPILSFTAEELWQHLPKQAAASVLLSEWYQETPSDGALTHAMQGFDLVKLELALNARQTVNKALEQARQAGAIGSSLDAAVTLFVNKGSELDKLLSPLGAELRFFLITSEASLSYETHENMDNLLLTQYNSEFLSVNVVLAATAKCNRCWQHQASVGTFHEHPDLCARCHDNVYGIGETRIWC